MAIGIKHTGFETSESLNLSSENLEFLKTVKMPADWSDENDVRLLIMTYKNFKCLYDTSHQHYKNPKVRKQSYEMIEATMRESGKSFSAVQLETKINNLRKKLSSELKALQQEKDYSIQFPFFKDLEFLLPFTKNYSYFNQTDSVNLSSVLRNKFEDVSDISSDCSSIIFNPHKLNRAKNPMTSTPKESEKEDSSFELQDTQYLYCVCLSPLVP